MNNIRLDNPCPMLLSRMKGVDGGHFCKSCSKVITDYTKLSVEEIRETMEPGSCGIFTSDQVTTPIHQSRFRHFLFYSLALLSFLGFNVKPLKAQTTQRTVAADTLQVNTEQTASTPEQKSWRKKTRKSEARKAKKTKATRKSSPRVMGCPEF